MNLMSLTKKVDILSELKEGNMAVLKGLPPSIVMAYGLALQNEVGVVPDSSIDEAAVNKAMLDRIADTGIKERLLKQMEEHKVTGE
ncbi:hypothetical protein [Priestia megaterium]|uniref:hypothetical protein n=1 Tax=Priestia megaterium TaxID=1404 RepID=UPI00263BDA8E|nr:hypothetical protein [Priestia megaterium]MDN4866246.1 hypothetical protein [Priestia megaterium]